MTDHRCPNCENDLTDAVVTAIVTNIAAGSQDPEPLSCPHCGEALAVTIAIHATLTRQPMPALVF